MYLDSITVSVNWPDGSSSFFCTHGMVLLAFSIIVYPFTSYL